VTDGLPNVQNGTFTLADAAWNEFVHAGHFLALGDALTLTALGIVAGIPVTWTFPVIVYLCVFAGNLHDRWADADNDAQGNPIRQKVMAKYFRAYWLITIVSLGIVIFLLLRFANIGVLVFAVVVFAIAILYTTALKPLTKHVVGFKSYVVALFYSLMVPLMATYYAKPINLAVFLVFAFYFVRIFISNVACDIKDTESDGEQGLKTFVVFYGSEKAGRILQVANLLSAIPIALGVYLGVLPMFSLALLLTIPYAFFYLKPNPAVENEVMVQLVIDAEFAFWLPLVLVGRVFL
jgi:4-hydroxybenzoate polyprenyltransferase